MDGCIRDIWIKIETEHTARLAELNAEREAREAEAKP